MSPTTARLLGSALALPDAECLELVEAILEASGPPTPALTDETWLAELRRRSAEIDAGQAVLTPLSQVKHRVRSRVENRRRG